MLEQLTFDTTFVTVPGVDPEAGFTEYEFDDALVKRAALNSARRKVVVADSTKLSAVAFVRLCRAGDVDILVTDSAAPADMLDALRLAGLQVIVA
jgi:DeoR/GlpR family transcriptional regulator of sugar metabolism